MWHLKTFQIEAKLQYLFFCQCGLDGEISPESFERAAVCAQIRSHQGLPGVRSSSNRYSHKWPLWASLVPLTQTDHSPGFTCSPVSSRLTLGKISMRHWASATESVLKLGLPWRVLRSQLVSRTHYGMVDYQQWIKELSITEPKLEVFYYYIYFLI